MTTTVNTTAGNSNNKEVIICDCCGCEMLEDDAITTANGDVICEDCECNEYVYCDTCGELHHVDDCEYVGGFYACDTCLHNWHKYVQDFETGEWVRYDDAVAVSNDSWGRLNFVSVDNFEENWAVCDRCGECFHIEDMHYTDYGYFCAACREYDHVYDYHCGPNLEMRNPDDDELTIGFELELNGGYTEEFVDEIYNAGILDDERYKAEEDSSLNDGVEIISAPFGASIAPRVFDEIEDICKAAQGASMRTCNYTGLHVHINKAYFNPSVDNMQYILTMALLDHYISIYDGGGYFKDYIKYTGRELNPSWCKMTREIKEINNELHYMFMLLHAIIVNEHDCVCDTLKTHLAKLKDFYTQNKHNRYDALNITNRETVEFRFCAASTNAQEVKERVAFVVGMAAYAKKQAQAIIDVCNNKSDVKLNDVWNFPMLDEAVKEGLEILTNN